MSAFRFAFFGLVVVTGMAGCTQQSVNQNTPDAKTFGQRQVEQMLDDRPDMKGVMPMSHPVVKWVIDGFDGKRFGQRIYWNANSPEGGAAANHARPNGDSYPPSISISGGAECTPVDKWVYLVFEMHNLQNDFESIWNQACEGKLDGDAYADQAMKLEFDALEKTRAFLRENPLPKSSHGRDKHYNWLMNDLGTFDDYKKATDLPSAPLFANSFKYYRDWYDRVALPLIDANRKKDVPGDKRTDPSN